MRFLATCGSYYTCISHKYITISRLLFSLVYESFKEYIAVETLDGDNKYDAGDYGMQVRIHPKLQGRFYQKRSA